MSGERDEQQKISWGNDVEDWMESGTNSRRSADV